MASSERSSDRGGGPQAPAERAATLRESLREALLTGSMSAKDLSKSVGIAERAIAGHLEHLARSLRHRGERLVMQPPECLACGEAFATRTRYTRPGKCPQCHSRRISLPLFRIEGSGSSG
jgi:predicted Zn-ribbon and HTH transcriptional regulator